ncbi:MAG: aminotransferase [Gemmatimonadetes bacterium]|nr:aminotransferase [Gemmatimonadota bacterium]
MSQRIQRPMGSDYLQWAKTQTHARFNLTYSGVPFLPLRELPVSLDDLELSGSGAYGWAPLQQAIADRYRVPVESVVAAAGTSMANHLAMAALLGPGDEVLMEHPTYEPLLAVARYVGATVVPFARRAADGFSVDPDEVARLASPRTRLIVLSNLHNPSGALTDDDTLRALAEIAERVDAHVLVDEVYLDALWEEPPRTSFHLGPRFVVTSSLTKVYGLNGLRCGWILAEPGLAARLWRLNELFSNINAHPAERLSVIAFQHLPSIAARACALLDANGAALNAFYRTRADLEVMEHCHGTVSFPRLREGSVDALCGLLLERYETMVVPGAFFGMEDHFRIALGVAPAVLAEGLNRLGAALGDLAQ